MWPVFLFFLEVYLCFFGFSLAQWSGNISHGMWASKLLTALCGHLWPTEICVLGGKVLTVRWCFFFFFFGEVREKKGSWKKNNNISGTIKVDAKMLLVNFEGFPLQLNSAMKFGLVSYLMTPGKWWLIAWIPRDLYKAVGFGYHSSNFGDLKR